MTDFMRVRVSVCVSVYVSVAFSALLPDFQTCFSCGSLHLGFKTVYVLLASSLRSLCVQVLFPGLSISPLRPSSVTPPPGDEDATLRSTVRSGPSLSCPSPLSPLTPYSGGTRPLRRLPRPRQSTATPGLHQVRQVASQVGETRNKVSIYCFEIIVLFHSLSLSFCGGDQKVWLRGRQVMSGSGLGTRQTGVI